MPVWRPDCFRGSHYEPEAIQYRPASQHGAPLDGEVPEERRGIAHVELYKKEGCGLGLIIAGGIDKGIRPHISNLRPGGIAHRSDCLQVGDSLLAVNGIRTAMMKHDEIINLLKNADEHVVLEVEYELPDCGPTDAFSVRCKQHQVILQKDSGGFGFTVRGGICDDRMKSRPHTITQIRPGGAADREGSLKPGDRILSVNDYSVVQMGHMELSMFLQQCENQTAFTVEFDISVIDAVQKATGPLLIEIDNTPGSSFGISLSHARHKGKHCVCVDSIKPMSMADRCGALHVGDHILTIDGASVEHMTVAEATQLLKSHLGDQIKLEILPIKLVEQKTSREIYRPRGGLHLPSMVPSISSPVLPTSPTGFGPSRSFSTLGNTGRAPSTEVFRAKHRSWMRSDKKMASSVSVASTNSVFGANNQICRTETTTVTLYGDRTGLGISLDGGIFSTAILEEPPLIARIEPNSTADKSGVLQEGDRILSINTQDVCEKTVEELSHLLQECWQRCTLEVEFDVADSVMASSGTFIVKLPKRVGGLGLTLNAPARRRTTDPVVITEVKKGSAAYRCGSVQAGDKLLAINDIRTENLTVEEATSLLKADEEVMKLKLKRDDHCTDENGQECITYTVELQKHGGPLGITITGTDEPFDPIVISNLVAGGLASRTGAIHIGDKVLAIDGVPTMGKTLSDARYMLQNGGDLVTIKIARPAHAAAPYARINRKSQSSDRDELYKSTTPVRSIDSALESWDSSGPEINGTSSNGHSSKPVKIPPKVPEKTYKNYKKASFSDSTDIETGDGCGEILAELHISDDAFDADMESSHSESCSEGDEEDWTKAFESIESNSEMLKQITESMRQRSTASLDRNSLTSFGKKRRPGKLKKERNWSHSTSRGAQSQDDLRPVSWKTKSSRANDSSNNKTFHDHMKTIFAPHPIQLYKVKLKKSDVTEDFGFGLSDGVYEKGVYISAVKPGSKADKAGLQPFDRILQVNGKKTRDFDCCLAVPLIAEAGKSLEIIVCRNPLVAERRSPSRDKSPPPDSTSPRYVPYPKQSTSADEGSHHYENVISMDVSMCLSDKSRKTV